MNHKASPTGADDIEANKWAEIIAEAHAQTKSDNDLVHLLWIIQGLQLGNYELEQTWRYVLSRVTNLLETERERVLDMVEAGLPEQLSGTDAIRMFNDIQMPKHAGWGYNKAIDDFREVIERLRGASFRKVEHSPETNLNNNAPGVEEK